MENKIRVYRVYSNFGNTEYSFCRTAEQAQEKINKAVKTLVHLGSPLSEESLRHSFYFDFTMETEENADYLLNF